MPKSFTPLQQAATTVGVPAAWLKREAESNRVPHLRAGRRLLFDVELLATTLLERSAAHCQSADAKQKQGAAS